MYREKTLRKLWALVAESVPESCQHTHREVPNAYSPGAMTATTVKKLGSHHPGLGSHNTDLTWLLLHSAVGC